MDRIRVLPVLAALTALAAALRLVGLGHDGLWLDEAFEAAASSGSILDVIFFETNHPPFHRLVMSAAIRLLGDSEAALRAPAAIFGILAVPAVFALAVRVADRRTAWFAAALTAVSPYLVYFSREARNYSLLILLTVLSCVAYLAWTRDGRRGSRAAWAVLAILGLHTHYFFVFVLLAQGVDLAVRFDRRARLRQALAPVAAVALATLPWTVHLVTNLSPQERGYVTSPLGNVAVTLFRFASGYALYLLDSRSALLPPAGQVRAALPVALAVLVAFAVPVAVGVRAAMRDTRRGGRLVLLLLALPPAILLLLSPVVPLLHDRYLAFAAPAFLILAAAGAARLPRGAVFLALMVAVSVAGLARARLDPRVSKEDWREVAALVREREEPGDTVVVEVDHVHWAFDHYYRGPSPRLLDVPGAESVRRGGGRVWLVRSHLPSTRGDCLDVLDGARPRRGEWDFPRHWGIRVHLFGPSTPLPDRPPGEDTR